MTRPVPYPVEQPHWPYEREEARREICAHVDAWAVEQGIMAEEDRTPEWWEEEF